MATCRHCQETIADGSRFCSKCGEADPVLAETQGQEGPRENDGQEKVIWRGKSSAIVIWPHWLLLFVSFGLWLPVLLYQYLKVKSCVFTVTTHRVTVRSGILSKQTDVVELYRVMDYQLREPLLYRIFGGYSTITLDTRDVNNPIVSIAAIKEGPLLLNEIRKHAENSTSFNY